MDSTTTAGRRLTYGFIAKATMVVLAVWALAQGLWLVRDILFIAFGAILLAVFLSLAVDRLDRVMPRGLAGAISLVVLLAVLVGFWIFAWPQLQSQISTIGEEVPQAVGSAVDWVQERWEDVVPAGPEAGSPPSAGGEGGEGPAAEQTMQQRLRTEAMELVAGALPLLNTAMGAVTGLIVTLFAAVFFVVSPRVYLDGFLHLVPETARPRLREALVEAGAALKRWIAGMSISMAIIFATSTIGLYLLGVPGAMVLGLIAGTLVFIPFIGPILSAIPAMAMALTVSPTMVLWVALLYLGIQLLESNILTPMVMKEAVELQPATTILFQMAMGVLFGFLGLLLAVPLLAALQVIVTRLYVQPLEGREGAVATAD